MDPLTGFAAMAGGLVLAALAGLLIPSPRRQATEPTRWPIPTAIPAEEGRA